MKITTFLLLISILTVSAASFAQKITLNEQRAKLEQVLDKIRLQSGYDIVYSNDLLNSSRPVTIIVNKASLDEALTDLLKDQPFNYQIEDGTVIIKGKEQSFFEKVKEVLTTIDVQGRVVDDNKQPILGANIKVKDGSQTAVTNADGRFYLKNVDSKATVIVSYVGYVTKGLQAAANMGDIMIIFANSQLDETRVIAYGTESRRFSVNSTAVLRAKDIEEQPVMNVLQALDGRVTGLVVTPTSGAPGATTKVQVRGQNTLNSSPSAAIYNQPIILIDGIPSAAQNVNIAALTSAIGSNNLVGNSGLSAINGLNPADIESISILKDADATAIYGSQGSNGVILITTKKGKPGKTQFNIGVNRQDNSITRMYQMMNTQQYLQMRRQSFANDNVTPTAVNAPDLVVYDQNKYTNWAQQFFNRGSANTDLHASVSGGTATSTFLVSGGYTHANYNFPGNYADNRLTLHSAFHHSSEDHKFTFDIGADLSSDQNNTSYSPSIGNALLQPPNTPDLIDPNGNLVWNYKGADLTTYQMFAYLKQPANLQNFMSNTVVNFGYEIIPGLKIALNSGYSRSNTKEYLALPLASLSPSTPSTTASFGANTYQTIYLEPQLTYKRAIGKGVFNALIGGTYKKDISYQSAQTGAGYSNDALLTSITGALTVTATDALNTHKYTDAFARLGYIYNEKYIVSVTGNRDASSNFGPGRQFANFGSAGLGWIFSEEKGFKKLLPFISYAKLAGNYGVTGNEGGSPYMFNSFWAATGSASLPFQGTRTVNPLNLYNPDFSWSTQKALNLSIDLGLFRDVILINAAWYVNKIQDQLVSSTLPSQTGFTSVYQNFDATVQNKGLEFTITSKNIQSKNFNWTSSFLISGNRNKLIAFPGLATSPYAATYQIGLPVSEVYGYNYKGVNPTTGVFEFYAADGKTAVQYPATGFAATGKGDQIPIANMAPNFQGNLGNTFRYKSFNLAVYAQFSDQSKAPNYLYGIYSRTTPGTMFNLPTALIGQFWEKPGDTKPLQRLASNKGGTIASFAPASGAAYFNQSSGVYSRDFYVRIKTVALSYTLSNNWIKRAHVSNARVFINAENLLTFTGYKFLDPELPGAFYSLPLQRVISAGLSIDFN